MRFSAPVWCCESLSSGIVRFWTSVAYVCVFSAVGAAIACPPAMAVKGVGQSTLCACYSFFSLGFLKFQSAALCHLVLLSLSPLPLLF